MDDRWREMWRMFHEAAALAPAERETFLREACGDDASLRSEVESLLRHDGTPEALQTQSSQRMNLIGQRIGVYEIRSLLGAGGMGEVYRARDTKLGREVAIKVLPPEFARDRERLARFEREARVLASLNHPHIAAIYGVEDSSGMPALVLELVEGETLAERIARAPIALSETLPIASQIAAALEAAHEQGIIHRDLKPANIKLTRDGAVKVLDFGLAKNRSLTGDVAPLADSVNTADGRLIGTAAYMSPEQVRGKPVDKRADIWAFGCVLFEMLTRRAPFPGETMSDTFAAVLEREPDWLGLPDGMPSACRRMLTRCLQKDPNRRLRDIGDAKIDIEEALDRPAERDTSPASVAPGGGRRTVAWPLVIVAAACAAAVLGGVVTFYVRAGPTDAADAVRFTFSLPDGWASGPTQDTGPFGVPGSNQTVNLAVSPDGSRLAFVAVGTDRQQLLWVRDIAVVTPRALPGTDGASSPFWSPEGRFIGFFADGKLKKIDASGGPAQTLCDAPHNRGGTWSSDDVIIFATAGGPLHRVPASGGTPIAATTLAAGEDVHVHPVFLGDSRRFLYRAITADSQSHPVYAASIDSSDRTLVLESSATSRQAENVGYSRQHLLFVSGNTLMRQRFDSRRLTTTGEAFPIAENVRSLSHNIYGVAYFSASPNGVLVYETGKEVQSQLMWYDRQGRELATLGDPGIYFDVRLSPSADFASVSVQEAGTLSDIWIYDVHLGRRTRFTSDGANDQVAIWSPKGDRIVFGSGRKGLQDLYVKATNEPEAQEIPLLEAPGIQVPEDWSPDGRSILFGTNSGNVRRDLWLLPLTGDRKPLPILHGAWGKVAARISPDGRWVAYQSNESGRLEVYVAPFQGPGATRRISTDGGNIPRWSRDGSELFFIDAAGWLVSAPIDTGQADFQIGNLQPLFQTRAKIRSYAFDVSPRGDRFLINTIVEQKTPSFFTVVLNWTAGIKNRD